MVNWQPLKDYLKENRTGLIREACFVLVVSLWVGVYVYLMRNSWNEIADHELRKSFVQATTKSLQDFESRINFWDVQSKKIASFVTDQTPATFRAQQETWSTLFDSHPEWLATHVVTRRQGFEASVPLTLMSRQAKELFPQELSSPVPWYEEMKSSAIQLTSAKTLNQPLTMQIVRSMDKEVQWAQVIFNIKRSAPGWSTWVVHTFSSKLLPEILQKTETHDSVLFFPHSKNILVSQEFQKQKIEKSEITGLLERNYNKESAFLEQEFAIAKKPVWMSWKHSKDLNVSLVRIIPNKKIPDNSGRQTPSLIRDWLLSFIWMSLSAMLLWWSYSKKLWHLSFKTSVWNKQINPPEFPEETSVVESTVTRMTSALASPIETEKEFCRHLLSELGPIGLVKLAGSATARVEVSPAPNYKGSWWILQNIDENRILIAIGAASGEGLAAGTAAYSVRHFIEVFLKQETESRDTEAFLSLVYDLCSEATKGVLLGTEHVSLFAAIIELKEQKMCYLNAGYRSPLLHLNSKKSICLVSYLDPIGLNLEGHPIPHWVNLPFQSRLVMCNIGARNIDLSELDDSELVKIYVYPFVASSHETAAQSDLSEDIQQKPEFNAA